MKIGRAEPKVVDTYGEHWRQSDKIHKITSEGHAGILSKVGKTEPEAIVTYCELGDGLPRLTKLQV